MQITDADWLYQDDIKPYVFMRNDNLFANPGTQHKCNWFKTKPLIIDPLQIENVQFADQILKLEGSAFQKSDMKMPRWVFYDCAIMPGVVCGFAKKTKSLRPSQAQALQVNPSLEWTPVSLFIIIPTVRKGEWVAHNLCSVNSLVENKSDQLYALGFLSKAFGLWYSNVEVLCGMFQWGSPAIKLHSHFGVFQILTAYTPVHSYAKTMTYRSIIDVNYWESFFSKSEHADLNRYVPTGFNVEPLSEQSIISLQKRIENSEGPYFLRPDEIREQNLSDPLHVWKM